MREIKFRGKTIPFVEDDYEYKGEWVYGYFHKTYKGECFIIEISETGLVLPGKKVVPESVGQFTGTKDNDGVEIYENHIVHYDGKPFHIYALKATGQIVNYKGSWALKYKQDWKTDCGREVFNYYLFSCEDFFHKKSNVLGNVFDNPELLKP